ncbi:MAG: hypothetical protein N2Z74_01275 [Syntrophales bacterium]|nr:hypothetical protein [Syntrophales bacterium]
MALDEPQNSDEIINDNGLTFLIDRDLLAEVQPIHVDFITTPRGSGFKLTSNLSATAGCGSCSSC